jgi:diaminopropionate ammonia-lyase family
VLVSAGDAALVLARNPGRDPGWRPPAGDEARAGSLHRALDGYAPSPLHDVRGLAAATGAGAVLLKDESSRFGLPAFKALGAWWAAACTVAGHLGEPALATAPAALRERAARAAPLTLACATEGNHGRAVARVARSLGVAAHVVVPEGTARTRVAAIEAEGALVERVAGDYDAAVAHAAGLAGPDVLVIADTSWPGYEEVPRLVVEGYGTIFAVSAAFDAFCATGDAHAQRGLRRLAGEGLDRGACAGGVAGALEILLGDPAHRAVLDLPDRPTVLALLTEGVTDPGAFAAAVGRPPRA